MGPAAVLPPPGQERAEPAAEDRSQGTRAQVPTQAGQEPANLLCKEPSGEHLRLCTPCRPCHNRSALPRQQGRAQTNDVAALQLNYKNRERLQEEVFTSWTPH